MDAFSELQKHQQRSGTGLIVSLKLLRKMGLGTFLFYLLLAKELSDEVFLHYTTKNTREVRSTRLINTLA